MGLDLSLIAVPKEFETILLKVNSKQNSEYSNVIFSLPNAFYNDFIDFNHEDWIEFKKDAQDIIKHYPENKFQDKFHLNTNRTSEVFDYLIAKKESLNRHFRDSNSFFYDGIKSTNCKSGQGFVLKYWDFNILQKKIDIFNYLNFEELFKFYDFESMVGEGVYKISQVNEKREGLKSNFDQIKNFLKNALELKGYVLILKT